MSIKSKMSIIMIATVMLLIVAVYVASQTLLITSVREQEEELTKQYLERINIAMKSKVRALNSTINDWADWDETYYFVQGRNEEYITDNLTESTLMNLRLNIVAMVDVNGKLVYGTMMDFENNKKSELNQGFLEHLEKNGPIKNNAGKNKITSGFITIPEGVLMISSKDILRSDESGPSVGTLIFGRLIDDWEINEIRDITGIPFSVLGTDSMQLNTEMEKAVKTLENGEKYSIQTIDENNISGYSTMKDIYGERGFYVKVDADRGFYRKAKEGTDFFLMAILLGELLILAISIWLLQKVVISRLIELNRFVNEIRSKQDTSLKAKISGNDEISNLADEMNSLLEEQNKTQEYNQKLIKEVMGYDELKNEFFSNISHEFRTPINVLLTTLQLINLQQQNLPEEAGSAKIIKYISIMKQNCYRLLRLSSNLVDITKMDSGFFDINPVNCNIVEVVEDITLSVAEYIHDKGIDLQFDTDVEEKTIMADPEKIERIMLNLLSNAVKFTDEKGAIYVNIRDKGEIVEISVRDTGIGIPEDKLNIIFERYRQVNSSLSRSHEGSGIGLSLVKSLVELHGGSIRAESEYGKGAEFIFELPANAGSEEAPHSPAPLAAQAKDDKINIEFSDTYSK